MPLTASRFGDGLAPCTVNDAELVPALLPRRVTLSPPTSLDHACASPLPGRHCHTPSAPRPVVLWWVNRLIFFGFRCRVRFHCK